MSVSIGIDYTFTHWACCVRDADTIIASAAFDNVDVLTHYLAQTCDQYPEALLMLAAPLAVAETSLRTYLAQQPQASPPGIEDSGNMERLQRFLHTICEFSSHIYLAPAVQFLPHVPPHRRLFHADLGSTNLFCQLVTLQVFMRRQQADWSEMNFTLLVLDPTAYRFLVVKQGQVVDGRSACPLDVAAARLAERQVVLQALLEQLTADLASIMAIHHLEDVVLLAHPTMQPGESGEDTPSNDLAEATAEEKAGEALNASGEMGEGINLLAYRDAIIEHFADLYQFFLYPGTESGGAGFEAAQGAALLADSLAALSPASELRAHLFAVPAQA